MLSIRRDGFHTGLIIDFFTGRMFAVVIATMMLMSHSALGQGNQQSLSGTVEPDPAVAALGPAFEEGIIETNGTRLHYVSGGSGAALILLHGWPEDWSEWRKVMPVLARNYRVVAIDLRGIGGSAVAADGFDEATLAADVHGLAERLGLRRPYVVGHDIGGLVAYAYARLYPRDTRGIMIVDVPLPGLEPWKKVEADPRLWHFRFHQTPNLPEALVAGRQEIYFRDFVDRVSLHKERTTAEDVRHFARSYGPPEKLRAGFDLYRAFPTDSAFNLSRHEQLDVPIVLAGGDHATAGLSPAIAQDLNQHNAGHVTVEPIKDSGHFVPEEQPDELVVLIKRYAGSRPIR